MVQAQWTSRADPLLERDAELAEVAAAIADARAGRGRALLIEGAAGAGKSALVAAARRLAEREGLRVRHAIAGEYEREYAFGCVRQLFEPVLRGVDGDERAALLAGAAAPAEWIVAPRGGDPIDAAEHAAAGFAALHALYWLTANLAADGPLLLAVDDVHWADEASVQALGHLARRIADLPVVLVAGLRPEEPGAPAALIDDLRAVPGVVRIVPRPLSAAAVRAIVRADAPGADDATCAACHAASAGNPLYLRELLRTFGEGDADGPGLAAPDAAARIAAASVPTLAARVGRRVARVASGAPALATAMAVLGDGEALDRAALLAGIDGATAAGIARRLRNIEVLEAEDPFAFVHPLVRRSVYDGLSVAERDAAHLAAARLLRDAGAPAEAIAGHLTVLRPSGSAEVAAGLRAAAGAASARAAPEAAIRLLRRALEEGAARPPKSTLLLELGRAELLGRDPGCVPHLTEARALATDVGERSQATVALADVLAAAGEWEASRTLILDALRELGEDADPEVVSDLEALRMAMMVNDAAMAAEFPAQRARFEALAAGPGWSARALSVLLAAQVALRGEDPEEAVALAERGLADGVLLGSRGAGAWAAAQAVMAFAYTEHYDRALEVGAEIEREARRSGSLVGLLGGPVYRGMVAALRGDLRAAEADLHTVLDLVGQTGMAMWSISAFMMFNDAVLERPGMDDVAAMIDAFTIPPSFMASATGGLLLYSRGRLRVARGDRSDGVDDLRGAAAVLRALGIHPNYIAWRSALALALPADGREEAIALADEELALARASGLPRALGVALRARALLDGDVALLEESVAVLERSEAELERARSLAALGGALRRDGRRVEARERLAAALELAHRCGAERLAAQAHEELRAAGGRPRRVARTGADALTASELRVARLAATGLANVEIAQELYVSVKTIETHLSHAYAKLGLSGQGARRRLAAALDEG